MATARDVLLTGALGRIGRPARRAVVATQLGVQRLVDRPGRGARRREAEAVADRLTIVVKAFERPHLLRRLVASLHRSQPGVRILVADDSREPVAVDGTDLVALPFDVGVSAGKNAGLAEVRTPFVALFDDDFVATRHTRLALAVAHLEAEPAIDLVGGTVVHLPSWRSEDYTRSALFPTSAPPLHPIGTLLDGLPVRDKVANFFVARTEALRGVGWDPELKRTDHTDFFTRARGVLTTVHDDGLRCLHAQDRSAAAYLAHRDDLAADRAVIARRWYGGRD